jgi:ribonuclease D
MAKSEDGAELVCSEAKLRALSTTLASARRLCLDAEGDGMFRYRARLCTVQLEAHGVIAIVDTLAVSLSPTLTHLLGQDGPEKIVHDVAFDARMLRAHGIGLGNVFDTAIAARFLGIKATGLSSLLRDRFGVHLDKSAQQADWGVRPLSNGRLSYLIEDVRHLSALADLLLSEVRAHDIESEVREETRYVLAQAAQSEPEVPAWTRVKGAQPLAPKERARLRELVLAREDIAAELDVPVGRVLASEPLLRLSARESLALRDVERALSAQARPFAARLLDAAAKGQSEADAPLDEVRYLTPEPLSPSAIEARRKRRKLLTELRAKEAERRRVDVQVILPGHCVSDMIALDEISLDTLASVSGFGDARISRYGARWVEMLKRRWPR